MWPDPIFTLFGYPINLYSLFYVSGAIPAYGLGMWLARERGIPPGRVLDATLVGGIGALAAVWAVNLATTHFQLQLPNLWGIPALAGAILAVTFYGWRNTLVKGNLWPALDVIFAPLALYDGISRIGCFTAGCCHGRPVCPECHFPWTVTFTNPHSASIYLGVPLYPTQLMLALGNFLLAAFLVAVRNHPLFRGALLWVYLIGYGGLRFGVEFYRGDVRTMVGDLYLSQVLGLLAALLGGVMLTRHVVMHTRTHRVSMA